MAKEEFRVYNSMTQQKEVFTPKEPGKVGMYVCGITAYDFSHIGHARAAVNFDVLYRYLKHLGYEVTYVRNFTDVDDKIIRRANESGENPFTLSDRFCQEYLSDMADLQCLSPTHQPRVSDHLEQIKDMITQIIKKEYGYVVDGDVFFSVDKFPNYGQLSGQKLENHRAGERVAVDSRKRNPADFALWKAAKPGEPSWESPWGPGRPGWHIECSAMSAHYLTFRFDIHGGGIDLIFPHHENEVAQSCAACQESKISYWMHNGHVTNNNEKMSKSLGNFFTIRQITERYHPLVLRHFLISAHYRSPLNYTISQLDSASDTVYYIYQTLQDCEDALSQHQGENLTDGLGKTTKKDPVSSAAEECISNLRSEFQTRMADDLNTAHILTGTFQEALKFINSTLASLKKKQPKKQQLSMIQSLVNVKKELREVLDVLGLLSSFTYSEVLQQLKDKALKRARMVEDDILRLIEDRTQARKNKDFARSDNIRAELSYLGIALMDVGKETIWRPCVPVELAPLPPPSEQNKPSPVEQKPKEQQLAQPPAVELEGSSRANS
ncbi:cysteine--tRNA ligase 2, cytoplasmic [Benincasa hispida]|uniref:cysteine--tRNA ligase 2, cytoplasmic n=1 Tax=Benincasa hispida TaxID=102211 RepID=UPI0019001670|nr:cysteine--tRNA ligase 2, cytoplasmic [Benincasa hispida]